jgi:hypothetical protein
MGGQFKEKNEHADWSSLGQERGQKSSCVFTVLNGLVPLNTGNSLDHFRDSHLLEGALMHGVDCHSTIFEFFFYLGFISSLLAVSVL